MLMLNSIGSAAASVSMHPGSFRIAQDVGQTQLAVGDRVHHDHRLSPESATAPAPASFHGECGGCCGEQGICECPCMHHAQALDASLLALMTPAEPGELDSSVTLGIPAPPLGEDIRPPIR